MCKSMHVHGVHPKRIMNTTEEAVLNTLLQLGLIYGAFFAKGSMRWPNDTFMFFVVTSELVYMTWYWFVKVSWTVGILGYVINFTIWWVFILEAAAKGKPSRDQEHDKSNEE